MQDSDQNLRHPNAAPEWQAWSLGWHCRELVVACPLEGLVGMSPSDPATERPLELKCYERIREMSELVAYYTSRMALLATITAGLIVLTKTILQPAIEKRFGTAHWLSQTNSNIVIDLVPVLALAIGERIVRKILWKIEKPEYNFSGNWQGKTTFEKIYFGRTRLPFQTEYTVRIEQDSFQMKILPSTGNSFVNWGSLALDLPDKDTVRYAYWVRYNDPSRFYISDRIYGYEEMVVTQRDKHGRPIEMTGKFFHCLVGASPLYSGTVLFTRT